MAGFQVESDRIEQAAVAVAETLGVPSLKEQQIEALVSLSFPSVEQSRFRNVSLRANDVI